jgi:cytochrome P450
MTTDPLSLDFAGWSASRSSAGAFYRQIQEYGGIHFDGTYWLISDYHLIKRIATDEVHFSAAPVHASQLSSHPLLRLIMQQAIFFDGADHRRIQRLIQGPLAHLTRPGSALLSFIDQTVQSLLDAVASQGKMDLAGDFAAPLTDRVMARVMGISTDDTAFIQTFMEGVDAFGDLTSGHTKTHIQSIYTLRVALLQILNEKRIHPGDDLLSAFLASQQASDSDPAAPVFRSEDELLATVMMLLGAGRLTAKKLLVDGTFLLLDDWEQIRREVLANPRCVNTLVERLLCYVTPTSYIARWAREDIQIGDQVMRAGQKVLLFLEAGNHLAVSCPPSLREPLDIQHPLPQPHLAFGPPKDPHFCIGAGLAREELRRAFAGLLHRYSTLSLAPDTVLSFHPNSNIGGLVSLPVCWGNR